MLELAIQRKVARVIGLVILQNGEIPTGGRVPTRNEASGDSRHKTESESEECRGSVHGEKVGGFELVKEC